MTRVSRGGLPAPPPSLSPIPKRDTPDSIRRLGREGGIGGRKVFPLVYITFTVATATTPPPRRRGARLYATMRILQI
ncbi:hypothetical protein ALC62_06099 [Cyphomyrmex costatus]|uniref:Uncharacterized protein n=1 Tax=Cyphomyrmex costatus TaxID=456900 RepID=A0A195CQT5_9HYME|nr:hypothetical protein ALC62_06099 [Cyphomyrmex costatus]